MTAPQHPTYLELLCRMAGVSMEALAKADASLRGLPAPYDGLRVTLDLGLTLRARPDLVYVGTTNLKPMREVVEVVIQATGAKLKRGTDSDIVRLKRGGTRTPIPAGCTDPFPAAFTYHADRLEKLLRYYLDDFREKAESGIAEAVRVTVERLRTLANPPKEGMTHDPPP